MVERKERGEGADERRDERPDVGKHALNRHLDGRKKRNQSGSRRTSADDISIPLVAADSDIAADMDVPSVPSTPLTESYSYHSPTPTAQGPYILGVDEAGRGPVLGPLVYGVAYCPVTWKDSLEELGFAGKSRSPSTGHPHNDMVDSKTLTHEKRTELLGVVNTDPVHLGWSVRVIRCGTSATTNSDEHSSTRPAHRRYRGACSECHP